jgi:hypothetical protein
LCEGEECREGGGVEKFLSLRGYKDFFFFSILRRGWKQERGQTCDGGDQEGASVGGVRGELKH